MESIDPVLIQDAAPGGAERPRLNLKPRNPETAAKLEAERQAAIAARSPFGSARPRESVIASRVGKSEEDILKEEVQKDKLHLRLNAKQNEERKAHEAAVNEVEDQIAAEEDEGKRDVLRVELLARQEKLDALMEQFAKATLDSALSGEAPRVSEMRRKQQQIEQQQQQQQQQQLFPTGRPTPQQYQYSSSHGGGHHQHPSYKGRYGRGGFSHNYQEKSGAGSSIPEWALQESDSLRSEGGYGGGISMGSYRATQYRTGAYEDSDMGFFDQPTGAVGSPAVVGGTKGPRGGSSGYRGRRPSGGHGQLQGFSAFPSSTPTSPPLPGSTTSNRGIGGEISIDFGQDRY